MNGKIPALAIVAAALLAGAGVYYAQVYAFYGPARFVPGAEIRLTSIALDKPEPIPVANLSGIDAASSPLRFRACFSTPLPPTVLAQTYRQYEGATPTNAPGWFGCFDAKRIGAALQSGAALAFLSEPDIAPEIDRVVAVFADGSAFAWHQISHDAGE